LITHSDILLNFNHFPLTYILSLFTVVIAKGLWCLSGLLFLSLTVIEGLSNEVIFMYIILGIGTAGYFAAKRLKEAGRKITLVDIKSERIDALREMGFDNVVEGDITSRELLKKLTIEQAKGVMVLTTDLNLNLRAAPIIREISEEVPLIVRAGKQDASEDFKGLEIDEVIYPALAVAEEAIESLEKLEAKKNLKRLSSIIKPSHQRDSHCNPRTTLIQTLLPAL